MSNKSKNQNQRNGQNIGVIHQQTVQQTVWQHPMPPPEILAAFKQVSPELVDVFTQQWVEEASHRRNNETEGLRQRGYEMESQRIEMTLRHQKDRHAMWLSFGLILSLLVGSVFLIFQGQQISGIATLISALSLFYFRKQNKGKE